VREARLAAQIEHPNVVNIYDVDQDEHGWFLVMEYLEGRTFGRWIADEQPDADAVIHVTRIILEALQACHDRNIIHQDLKPDNVFICRDASRVKILDLGVSRKLLSKSEPHRLGVAGTLRFMSPEQMSGEDTIDFRTDIFSVGVILFLALTGHYPFPDSTPGRLLMSMHSREKPSVLTHRPDLPDLLDDIISRALAHDQASRFGSAREMSEALGKLRTGRHVEQGDGWRRRLMPSQGLALVSLVICTAIAVGMFAAAVPSDKRMGDAPREVIRQRRPTTTEKTTTAGGAKAAEDKPLNQRRVDVAKSKPMFAPSRAGLLDADDF
jgi:serine/threonine protein kinase